MTREELETAAAHLRTAADTANAETDRLTELADQLDGLATRDRDTDHGRLARIQNALGDLRDDVGADAAPELDAADDAIDAYRQTLEGV